MTFEKKDQILISGVFKEYCDEATMSGQALLVLAHQPACCCPQEANKRAQQQ
jgi:hypothetical protein